MLNAFFMSTYILHLLFLLIKCTITLILNIVVRKICEVCQARSTVTTSPISMASCYIIQGTLLQHTGHVVTSYTERCYSKELVDRKASVTRTCYCYYINWIIHTYTSYSVHNNVGVHSFI